MTTLHKCKRSLTLLLIAAVSFSCSEINFELPQGPEGPQGPQGLSTYEIWKEQVENGTINWPKDKVEVGDFMVYIKGEKGDRGENGKSAYDLWKDLISTGEVTNPHNPKENWSKDRNTESDFWDFLTGRDGVSPHIGDNGNWWIGYVDTKVPARGQDGKDGQNGVTPHIGQNGNWWIGITDTQIPAKGQNGQDGVSPHIGQNGNWWIGTTDTKVPAKGQDGKDGISAYESWKQLAVTGDLDDPKNPGMKWPSDRVEVVHFIQYLTGANGKDGVSGKDGKDGIDGETPYIGSNGNWWIGTVDTKVPAKGQDGKDGIDGYTPYVSDNGNWFIDGVDTGKPSRGENGKEGLSPHIGDNGNWWIGTTDTGKPSRGDNGQDGQNGVSPHIGDNGSWWIGTTDTGVPAKGEDGEDGTNGTDGQNGVCPHIGDNGNWWIGTTDTGVPARGENGLSGVDGKSAYELWVEDVKKGTITDPNTGSLWPTTEITQADFWRYLMGKDGADGQDGSDGKDGVDGKSAYEIWKEMAATGNLDDPKNPGQKWDSSKTAETDFWLFLMGKDGADGQNGINGQDGQSAYELWVEEVEKGLKNPHDEEGNDWPKDKTSTDNFWEYLSGKDGQDGEPGEPGEPGKPGEPGEPMPIIKGVPNVIAQYSLQDFGEYVRWTDGAVLYKVYNNVGELSPGAKVKGLPGMDPNKEYTANDQGEFLIPREDLPEGKPIEELFGKAMQVTYQKSTGATVTEASAANTYVPNRIDIRLIHNKDIGAVGLGFVDISIWAVVERNINTPDSEWENIPSYLGNLTNHQFNIYDLADKDDPTSFDEATSLFHTYKANMPKPTIRIKRPAIKASYVKKLERTSTIEWDGKDHYHIIQMDSYYGMKPILPSVIKMAPIQYMALIKEIKNVKGYSSTTNMVDQLTVVFDASEIDPNLIYNNYYLEKTVLISGIKYEYYTPIQPSNVTTRPMFRIEFEINTATGMVESNNIFNEGTFSTLESTIKPVHVGSTVEVSAANTNHLLDDKIRIGKLVYDKETKILHFIGRKDEYYDIPDIRNIPVEE